MKNKGSKGKIKKGTRKRGKGSKLHQKRKRLKNVKFTFLIVHFSVVLLTSHRKIYLCFVHEKSD